MLDSFFSFFSYDLGIDLGTSNTRVFVRGKGIVIREPSVLARQKKSKEILAIGEEAKNMIGKNPANLEIIKPLRHGVIADFDATLEMLTFYIKKVHESKKMMPVFSVPMPMISKPKVIISIPSGVTEVERKAVQDAALSAGARKVFLVEEPLLAAIGTNLDILSSQGILIVNIGGGKTELAVISLGGIVQGKSLRLAGNEMDGIIANHLRLKYSLLVGELSAENLKKEIGSALLVSKNEEKKAVVRGRGLETGMPMSVKVEASEVREALSPIVGQIVAAVEELIESTPPELLTDIAKIGICLCGSGANLIGLDRLIFETTKIPTWVVEHPEDCVVKGCGKLLENEKLLKKVKVSSGLR